MSARTHTHTHTRVHVIVIQVSLAKDVPMMRMLRDKERVKATI